MIELRGIAIDCPADKVRKRLIIRGPRADIYKTIDFPDNRPLNKGQIISYLMKELAIERKDIYWPHHVAAPEKET